MNFTFPNAFALAFPLAVAMAVRGPVAPSKTHSHMRCELAWREDKQARKRLAESALCQFWTLLALVLFSATDQALHGLLIPSESAESADSIASIRAVTSSMARKW